MSAPKLSRLLSAIKPDGTFRVRVDHSGEMEVIEPLEASLWRMALAFEVCLYESGRLALSEDEFEGMIDMSLYAIRWLKGCCLQLGLTVLQ